MGKTIIAVCCASASLIAGIVAPMVIPPTLPDWIRYGFLGLAAALYVVAFVIWIMQRKAGSGAGPSQATRGPDSPILSANTFEGPVTFGAPSIAQTHHGSGHNIVADNVSFAPPRFVLSEAVKHELFNSMPPGATIRIASLGGRESDDARDALAAYFRQRGIEVGIVGFFNTPSRKNVRQIDVISCPNNLFWITFDATAGLGPSEAKG